ncbi:MAG: phosphoenolpyruvate carboxykinase (ATP) [Planctomycetes bacterium]|nr:phosphoenolpyruvate carboxykinase (ATP) [Planctomycetota bacterium]
MTARGHSPSSYGLEHHGITDPGDLYWNLPPAELYEHALRSGSGRLAADGAIVCTTGAHTGRSPSDKYLVDEPATHDAIWWGPVNKGISEAQFDSLHRRVVKYYRGRPLYIRDMYAGADPATQLPIRVVTETAWHNLFATQLFIRPAAGTTAHHTPRFTILNAPGCKADPKEDGTRSETFVIIHFTRRLVLIGGTAYAGEIKKSIFTIMNYLLPKAGVLSMHCSANIGAEGDVALFFGLSGTGKTTLSADPQRRLIGDDEHGWGDHGVFNIEGGCYAKCIKLSREYEPQIYGAIRFGTVLENVVLDEHTREIDFASDKITENTRAAYPLEFIDNAVIPSVGGHPRNVVFLTCDAFGILPPIARLTPEQAMYHFLAGYTAKVAGTEAGVTEPKATFSTCFGAPFLPLPPETYATMLGERLARHKAQCWLVNTGWSGGGVGVGQRMNLRHTRALVKAALTGALGNVVYAPDAVFGVAVPRSCPDVPVEILSPRSTWPDPAAYDAKARELAALFLENVRGSAQMPRNVAACAPRV